MPAAHIATVAAAMCGVPMATRGAFYFDSTTGSSKVLAAPGAW